MSYIGSTPTTQSFIAGTDYFNGTGSQTAFTLSRNVVSANDIQATVNNVVQQPNDAYTVSGTTITFTSAPSAGTNNIYVRYLSTTTQSITPSQNTVSYSTLNTDMQSGGYASNFKNRLINGAMMIDQRNAGASVTSPASGYTLDRWNCNNDSASKYSIQQNAGSVTPPVGFTNYLGITSLSSYSVPAGEVYGIQQRIEGFNVADLGWGTANAQTVTLSFWVRSSLTGTHSGSFYNAAYTRGYAFAFTVSAANTWEYKTITVTGDTTGTWLTNNGNGVVVNFSLGTGSTNSRAAGSWGAGCTAATGSVSVVGTSGATFYITGVQLEKGSTATSFDYRPYGTELALCQRYLPVLYPGSYLTGLAASSVASYAPFAFTVTPRAAPTGISFAAGTPVTFTNGSGNPQTVTSLTFAAGSLNNCLLLGITSGLTLGQSGFLSSTTNPIFFTGCEL
jgi:hypothetical protein